MEGEYGPEDVTRERGPEAAQDPAPVIVHAHAPVRYRPAPPTPARDRATGLAAGIALVIALAVGTVAGGVSGFTGGYLAARDRSPRTVIEGPVGEVDGAEPVAVAASAALPSIVNIDVSGPGEGSADEEGMPDLGVPIIGNGSGVAFKAADDGGTYILTNNHVIEDAESIIVKGTDRERHEGELVGADPDTDIAVVKVDAELPVIEVADSDGLQVGELVVAIGSPFGLSHSVTSGVVSAIGRSLPDSLGTEDDSYPLVDVIQTDAAINPGNSGGALVDRLGRLVGINTAIYSESGASGGIGFAIPARSAVGVADQLIATGNVQHPFLGIVGQSVDPVTAKEQRLPVAEGALVVEIQQGTSAAEAGIKAGDLIVGMDDAKIRTMDDLILEVRRRRIGDTVSLRIYRGRSEKTLRMTVGTKPSDNAQ